MAEASPPDLSRDASRLYARAKPSLFQVRLLTRTGRSQIATGSGFVIDANGHAITNYHVVSSLVLDPDRYVAEAIATGGETDELQVLKVDVRNDLALIRLKTQRSWPALAIERRALTQGERLYSLGNPLGIGFTIVEGSFNGIVTRPYYPQILFSGPLNPGMSGGPSLDASGRVVGVNVSKMTNGEQISFLVPAQFISELTATGLSAQAQPSQSEFEADIARQLHQHQATMATQLLAAPLPTRALGPYRVPVTEAPGIRCWASDTPRPDLRYQTSQLQCRPEAAPYLQGDLQGGFISVQHDYFWSDELSPYQFLHVLSKAFGDNSLNSYKRIHWTGAECSEAFVQRATGKGVPLRAVICIRAMKKFDGLYSFGLQLATVDEDRRGVITRVLASAVDLDNGQRILQAFIDATERTP